MLQQKNLKLCKYFFRGYCRFGSHCNYSHNAINCFLIRHAKSQFNEQVQINQDYYFQFSQQQFQFNPEMIDCSITKKGLDEIYNMDLMQLSDNNKLINIDGIFVSPLQRALKTTQHFIQIHNIKPKQVIVLANLTQVLSKICDFMNTPSQTIKKYPKYNFTYFTQFIQNNEQKWQDYLVDQNYHHLINQNQLSGFRYLNLLSSIYPTPLQTSYHCFHRSMRAINQIKQICLKLSFHNIIIISHNRILKYISGKDQAGKVPGLLNCQIRHIYL